MIKFDPGTVEIQLPFKKFRITYKRKVGFRFNIAAWAIMCDQFDPPIEFHQIDELTKTNPKELFEKMILAGCLSYESKYKVNQKVTLKNIKYWLYKLPAEQAQKFTIEMQTVILSSKAMGKSIAQIVTEKREEEKKN